MFETSNVSVDVINQAFVDRIEGGQIKEAQEAGSAYIRQRLYEEGVLRRLFPPRTVTADELDPDLNSDTPGIIVEKEPDAPKATYVPFRGIGDANYFYGKRFRIPFGKIESDHMQKSKFELLTMKMDIMEWLKQNQVKQVQGAEDEVFMESVNKIITDASGAQNITQAADTTFKDAFVLGLKGLTKAMLPVGPILMHQNTYYDSSKLKVEDIGDSTQAKRFNDGVEGEDSFMGHRVITTLKTDICPENEIYFFAPADYFVRNYLIQDATLFLKQEADLIFFHTYEAPGCGIGNTLGVYKVTLL